MSISGMGPEPLGIMLNFTWLILGKHPILLYFGKNCLQKGLETFIMETFQDGE